MKRSMRFRDEKRPVTSLDKLIIRLQRMGYCTQTFGDEIVLEFDAHSKLRGSREQIERMLPSLAKHSSKDRLGKGQPVNLKWVKKRKKSKKRKGKIIVTSAAMPTISAETRGLGRLRRSKSSGGLPSLGKRR